MALTPRTSLVAVDLVVLSSYPLKRPRLELRPLGALSMGKVPQDVATAILKLHQSLTLAEVDFRITDCRRDIAEQAAARAKHENYLRWVVAGKVTPFDPNSMKVDYVALPGFSFHNAGRAIDINLECLRFKSAASDKQLDALWETARPLGWRPIIKEATEGKSESWHFDFMGEWLAYYLRSSKYDDAAMCASLDIGVSVYPKSESRMLQAQLQRAGYDCGTVDGDVGAKSQAALKASGFAPTERDYTKLFKLPSSSTLRWKP